MTESLPAGNTDVASVATPLVTVDVPSEVAPFVKVTVPVTFVGSVAVKVTDWLNVEGLVDEVRVSAGEAFVTVCVVVPVAGPLFVSPP